MISVVLADEDELYCRHICARLSRDSKNYAFDLIHSNRSLSEMLFSGKILDINALKNHYDINKTVFIVSISLYLKFSDDVWKIMLIPGMSKSLSEYEYINKFSHLENFFEVIDRFVSENPDLSLIPFSNGIECIIGNACNTLKKKYLSDISENKLKEGYKVVILDLCPPHLAGAKIVCDASNTLTEAFLRIMAEDFAHADIGQYLVSSGNGILHFRPVEKADDLFECSPKEISILVDSIIEWIKQTQYSYYFFINCSEIPFSFIYTTAVMCDHLTILNSQENNNENSLYNRELSYLTSNLPSTCTLKYENLSCIKTRHIKYSGDFNE